MLGHSKFNRHAKFTIKPSKSTKNWLLRPLQFYIGRKVGSESVATSKFYDAAILGSRKLNSMVAKQKIQFFHLRSIRQMLF